MVLENQMQNESGTPNQPGREGQDFPSVIFKIQGNMYCVDSRYIEALIQLPEFVTLPDAPPVIRGVFPHRGDFVTIFDMRTALGMRSLADEFDVFAAMLDKRKEEHIQWVEALETSIRTGEAFKLSHDPHACAFGRWYDNFKSDEYMINAHLKKIDEPHQRLHRLADEMDACRGIADPVERERRLEALLQQAGGVLMPAIVRLLDETKEVFRDSMLHEMTLVLSDARLGLVVDEVMMVEQLLPARQEDKLSEANRSSYLAGIRRSRTVPNTIFELDIPRILQAAAV